MIKETIKIFLTSGSSLEVGGSQVNKELLFGAVDEPTKWITIETKTINTNQITYFEIFKEETIEE